MGDVGVQTTSFLYLYQIPYEPISPGCSEALREWEQSMVQSQAAT